MKIPSLLIVLLMVQSRELLLVISLSWHGHWNPLTKTNFLGNNNAETW